MRLINREPGSYVETIISISDVSKGWFITFASGYAQLITGIDVASFVSAALDAPLLDDERTHFDAQVLLNTRELIGFVVQADVGTVKLSSGKIIPWVRWSSVKKELARP